MAQRHIENRLSRHFRLSRILVCLALMDSRSCFDPLRLWNVTNSWAHCHNKRPFHGSLNIKRQTTTPTNQPTNQSTNQPTNQSINQSINQPINQSTNQPINQPTNQPINPNQPTKHDNNNNNNNNIIIIIIINKRCMWIGLSILNISVVSRILSLSTKGY